MIQLKMICADGSIKDDLCNDSITKLVELVYAGGQALQQSSCIEVQQQKTLVCNKLMSVPFQRVAMTAKSQVQLQTPNISTQPLQNIG